MLPPAVVDVSAEDNAALIEAVGNKAGGVSGKLAYDCGESLTAGRAPEFQRNNKKGFTMQSTAEAPGGNCGIASRRDRCDSRIGDPQDIFRLTSA